jgi:hypothetical protein
VVHPVVVAMMHVVAMMMLRRSNAHIGEENCSR